MTQTYSPAVQNNILPAMPLSAPVMSGGGLNLDPVIANQGLPTQGLIGIELISPDSPGLLAPGKAPDADSTPPTELLDRNSSPSDIRSSASPGSLSSSAGTGAGQLPPVDAAESTSVETEKIKQQLADALERTRRAEDRVYAAEKAAQAAEKAMRDKQESLTRRIAELERKLAASSAATAELAAKAAADRETKSKQLPTQLQSLEKKLKALQQQLEKALAEREALALKLKTASADKQPKPAQEKPESKNRVEPKKELSKPNQPKGEPQPPKRAMPERSRELANQKAQSEPSSKPGNLRPDGEVDSGKKSVQLVEKLRALEQTLETRLKQSNSRITKRFAGQKKRLIDNGAKDGDQKLVDLDKRLQAELNNSATNLQKEYAGRIEEMRAEIKRLQEAAPKKEDPNP